MDGAKEKFMRNWFSVRRKAPKAIISTCISMSLLLGMIPPIPLTTSANIDQAFASTLNTQSSTKERNNSSDKRQSAEKALHKINVPFIKNQGQVSNNNVKYYANIFSGTLFVTEDGELTYALTKPQQTKNFDVRKATKTVQVENQLKLSALEQIDKMQTETKEQTLAWSLKEKLIGAKQVDLTPKNCTTCI
jgi:hypothetical protein